MQYRPLGASGIRVSVLGFGAWQIGDSQYWGDDAESDAQAAVEAALDAGVNFFDTAEIYGDGASEEALGKALGARRDEVVIASKVAPDHCAPDKLIAACEASLRRLGTDYIDLYQVHWPFHDPSFEEAYGALDRLRHEGKIRAIGVSNFGKQDLTDWLAIGDAASNQVGYNLVFRAAEYDIAPLCRRNDVAVIAYMPLMQGLLSGRWEKVEDIPLARRRTRHFSSKREGTRHGERGCERLLMETLGELRCFADAIGLPLATVALCWLLAQPGVSSAIIGARKPQQVVRNIQAAELDIGPAAIAQINEISAPLKRALGPNADMWESEENARIR